MKLFIFIFIALLPALSFAEIEPNNSSTQANRMTLSVLMHGQLSSREDVDWYVVRIDAGSSFSFEVSSTVPAVRIASWHFAIYNSAGVLMSKFESGLSKSEIRQIGISQPGDYHIVVFPDTFYSSDEYRITVRSAAVVIPGSPFSGAWQTSDGRYISIHQNGGDVLFVLLHTEPAFHVWEALSGTAVGTIARVTTIYGWLNVQFAVELKSSTTMQITQISCSPLIAGYTCKYPNGTVLTATKVF